MKNSEKNCRVSQKPQITDHLVFFLPLHRNEGNIEKCGSVLDSSSHTPASQTSWPGNRR